MNDPIPESPAKGQPEPNKAPIKKPRRLTLKQERFAQEYVRQEGNATKAAQIVYHPPAYRTAQNIASETLSNPIVNNRITQILNQSGLDLPSLCTDLNRIKNTATRPLVVDKEVIDVEDTPTKLEAIKTGFKLHGVLNNQELSTGSNNLQVNISLGDSDRIAQVIHKLDTLSNSMGFLVEDGEVTQ